MFLRDSLILLVGRDEGVLRSCLPEARENLFLLDYRYMNSSTILGAFSESRFHSWSKKRTLSFSQVNFTIVRSRNEPEELSNYRMRVKTKRRGKFLSHNRHRSRETWKNRENRGGGDGIEFRIVILKTTIIFVRRWNDQLKISFARMRSSIFTIYQATYSIKRYLVLKKKKKGREKEKKNKKQLKVTD